jgi:hypothetical protein
VTSEEWKFFDPRWALMADVGSKGDDDDYLGQHWAALLGTNTQLEPEVVPVSHMYPLWVTLNSRAFLGSLMKLLEVVREQT